MRYSLVVLDVDGTLLDSEHRLRPRVAAAVRSVQAAGIRVALATGKLLTSIRPLLATLAIEGPQIVLNGAATIDSATDAALRFCPLADDARRHILTLVRAADAQVLISQFGRDAIFMDTLDRQHPRIDIFAEYGEGPPILVPDLFAQAQPPTAKILLSGSHERLAALRAGLATQLPLGVSMTTTTPDFLEFFDAAAGKGQALVALREMLGLPRDAILAVGDGENDVPLLREAGFAVAMANGAPTTRAVANTIAPSNDEDGVAVILEALLAQDRI
jgi:Cof subfamily protein (haloacid dehalogenase superfamily)